MSHSFSLPSYDRWTTVQACGICHSDMFVKEGHCALTGIRPLVETFPLEQVEQAAVAYDRMLSGKARCRVVLTMK